MFSYQEIISKLNSHQIIRIEFSLRGYTHYKSCSIFFDDKVIPTIFVKLTPDQSECVSFYKKFKENYKLFYLGRGKSLTLRQAWDMIEIREIVYKDSELEKLSKSY